MDEAEPRQNDFAMMPAVHLENLLRQVGLEEVCDDFQAEDPVVATKVVEVAVAARKAAGTEVDKHHPGDDMHAARTAEVGEIVGILAQVAGNLRTNGCC